MKLTDAAFAQKKYMTVNSQRMAYIDEGKGDAIVFRTAIQPRPSSGATSCRQSRVWAD
jgi:hypothetical protein